MDSAAISAIGQGVSSLFGGAGSIFSSGMSYKNAKRLQAAQNAWMERMSNTAYQRATTDMRAANLNPALMYGSGSAASTPSAGSATSEVGNPVTAALEAKQAYANVQATQANAAYAKEQALTEANKRENLDADSSLKRINAMVEDKTLPYSLRKMAAETQNLVSMSHLNDEIRKYTGYNAESNRMQANAARTSAGAAVKNAETNAKTLDVKNDYDERYKKWGQSHPYLRNVLETYDRVMRGASFSSSSGYSEHYNRGYSSSHSSSVHF